jgi:hypothetical protein
MNYFTTAGRTDVGEGGGKVAVNDRQLSHTHTHSHTHTQTQRTEKKPTLGVIRRQAT